MVTNIRYQVFETPYFHQDIGNYDKVLGNQDNLIGNKDKVLSNQDYVLGNQVKVSCNQDTVFGNSIIQGIG